MVNLSFRFFQGALALLFIVSAIQNLSAQQAETLIWFDREMGIENTGLYQGEIYLEQHRTINDKTKFFNGYGFKTGSAVYNGNGYYDLLLSYDVFGDNLLLRQEDRLGAAVIKLIREDIEEFTIEASRFVNIRDKSVAVKGFYEIGYEDEILNLLIKHRKRDFKKTDRSAVYYEFSDLRKNYLLYFNNSYFEVQQKKDWVLVFPELKREINSFYQRARRLKSSDPQAFNIALARQLGDLLDKKTKGGDQ